MSTDGDRILKYKVKTSCLEWEVLNSDSELQMYNLHSAMIKICPSVFESTQFKYQNKIWKYNQIFNQNVTYLQDPKYWDSSNIAIELYTVPT